MFKIDMRYTNGKIYKLVSNVTGDVYYGSTIRTLKERLEGHKVQYKRYLQDKYNYVTSFKILETGDYNIYLVEDYACLCKKQLEAIERVYIEGYKCINKVIPTRTRKETCKSYYQNNIDKIKEYREKNREHSKIYFKKRHQMKKNDERYMKMRSDYQKQYRKNVNQNVLCECGKIYTKSNKARHMKSNKHQKYINKI